MSKPSSWDVVTVIAPVSLWQSILQLAEEGLESRQYEEKDMDRRPGMESEAANMSAVNADFARDIEAFRRALEKAGV